jgi:hypothetical protein
MVLPIEETNLAGIGSDEDKALKEAAAKIDFSWDGSGQAPGLEIWRVENTRTENDNPDFGIKVWAKEKYGQFHRGDSYIVLLTSKDHESDALQWDVHFWIGSESSQDEYGVAAYKANELGMLRCLSTIVLLIRKMTFDHLDFDLIFAFCKKKWYKSIHR